jgi:hypothetical protein
VPPRSSSNKHLDNSINAGSVETLFLERFPLELSPSSSATDCSSSLLTSDQLIVDADCAAFHSGVGVKLSGVTLNRVQLVILEAVAPGLMAVGHCRPFESVSVWRYG